MTSIKSQNELVKKSYNSTFIISEQLCLPTKQPFILSFATERM